MRIHILGSAAGGGFPQWNCNCRLCAGVRAGSVNAKPRTQSSIAVSGDGESWLLCDASPDILTQLRAFPGAAPSRGIRDSGLRAIVLTDAQIDHATGLILLREHRTPLNLWCTPQVHGDLSAGYPLVPLLDHFCGVTWNPLAPNAAPAEIPHVPGIALQALPIASNAPPYSPRRDRPEPGDNLALLIRDTRSGKQLFYAPGLGVIDDAARAAMATADCVLVDGTCWTDDEMIAQGISSKRAADMGHRAVSGADGMLAELARLPSGVRRMFIHINNTNPMLDEDGPEYAQVRAAGITLAEDAMEFDL